MSGGHCGCYYAERDARIDLEARLRESEAKLAGQDERNAIYQRLHMEAEGRAKQAEARLAEAVRERRPREMRDTPANAEIARVSDALYAYILRVEGAFEAAEAQLKALDYEVTATERGMSVFDALMDERRMWFGYQDRALAAEARANRLAEDSSIAESARLAAEARERELVEWRRGLTDIKGLGGRKKHTQIYHAMGWNRDYEGMSTGHRDDEECDAEEDDGSTECDWLATHPPV